MLGNFLSLISGSYEERRDRRSRLLTVTDTGTPLTTVLPAPSLLTGAGCTTWASWASCRLFTTSSMSMISWFCSIISLGGRLGPLQVSRGQRQTVTYSRQSVRVELSHWSRSVQILCSHWWTPFYAGSKICAITTD